MLDYDYTGLFDFDVFLYFLVFASVFFVFIFPWLKEHFQVQVQASSPLSDAYGVDTTELKPDPLISGPGITEKANEKFKDIVGHIERKDPYVFGLEEEVSIMSL
jgi:hypothetical protein